MALGSAGLSGTGGSHDKYVPEVWSKRIQSAFQKRTIARNYCLDLTEMLGPLGGDVLHVPKLANRSATTRTLTSFAQITPAGATEDEFSMNVQTWIIDPEFVSDALPEQTKIFQKGQIDGKMQSSLAVKFDTDLWANYTSLTTTAQGTDDGVSLASPDNIFDALETLTSNDVPADDRVILLSPKTLFAFIKNDVIPSGDYSMNRAKETGNIPMLGGVPVFVSNNLPTTANGSKVNLVLHKEAFAFAIAKEARVRSQDTLDHLGETIVGDMLYGSGAYRLTAGVVVYSK
jgi:hypothetical protein